MTTKSMSRRSFFAGSAALAALGGLAFTQSAFGEPASDEASSTENTEGLPEKWDKEVDVVVIGSGSILPAAFTAYERGLTDVVILEKSPTHFGGTSYFAGGGCSCPNSTLALEAGQPEIPRDLLKQYIEETAAGQSNDTIIEAMLDNYVPAVDFLTYEIDMPTIYASSATPGYTLYTPQSCLEEDYNAVCSHVSIEAYEDGRVMNRAWFAYFKDRLEERNIEVMMGTTATKLIYKGNPYLENGEVVGVYADTEDGRIAIKARYGVVIGTGGFDHNQDMMKAYIPNPMYGTVAVDTNTGDGHRMAAELGAEMRNMKESFRMAFIRTQEEMIYTSTDPSSDDGVMGSEQTGSKMLNTPGRPGSIIVNKYGNRFVDESANYDGFGMAFEAFDVALNEWTNIPGYLIFDDTYNGPLGHAMPSLAKLAEENQPLPSYVEKFESLEELAEAKGINKENLLATVERFNSYCETGVDLEFHRGDPSWDKYTCGNMQGFEAGEMKNPCMTALVDGPFYVMEVYPGMMQTKGGLVINEHAQVMNVNGNPIPRLYAGSCTIANPLGRGYGWGGGTIANGFIPGYMAGEHLATLTPWDGSEPKDIKEKPEYVKKDTSSTEADSASTDADTPAETESVDCAPCHGDAHKPGDENPHGY